MLKYIKLIINNFNKPSYNVVVNLFNFQKQSYMYSIYESNILIFLNFNNYLKVNKFNFKFTNYSNIYILYYIIFFNLLHITYYSF